MNRETRHTTLNYDADKGVFDLDASILTDDFRADVRECVAAQKAVAGAVLSAFKPNPRALAEVSGEALARLLEQGKDVRGISKQLSISDVIVFSARNIPDSLRSATVEALREGSTKGCTSWRNQSFREHPGSLSVAVGISGTRRAHTWDGIQIAVCRVGESTSTTLRKRASRFFRYKRCNDFRDRDAHGQGVEYTDIPHQQRESIVARRIFRNESIQPWLHNL